MDQMDLAQVRRRRIPCDPRPVLDGLAGVGVAFDTDPGDEPDRVADRLAERVPAVTADGSDAPEGDGRASLRCAYGSSLRSRQGWLIPAHHDQRGKPGI
jgi:hypothetical protein